MGSHAARNRKAREILPGYPKDFVFESPEKIEQYFNHVEITCLLCGRQLKSLGHHLKKIHGMSADDYKEKYGLPWRKGLMGVSTREQFSEHGKKMQEDGIFESNAANREKAMLAIKDQRKRQPYRSVLTSRNLDKMNEGKTGEDAERRKNASKRGTEEYREIMLSRPQTKNPSEEFVFWWKGKHQSYEHVLKRTGSPPKRK